MTRPAKTPLLFVLPLFCFLHAGCQRSMGGSMATGPFAPAGTGGTASAPLFPIGPVNGATRVPPPPTGNATPTNGYNSPPTASNFGAGQAATLQVNANNGNAPSRDNLATNVPPSSADTFRNSLAGMPVIDMTSNIQSQSYNPAMAGPAMTDPASLNSLSSNAASPVGSGVYGPAPGDYGAAGRVVESSTWARQPTELLRPIEQPIGAVPVPRYRGIEDSVSPLGSPVPYVASAVQPAGGFPSTDAWQSVQPGQSPASGSGVVQSRSASGSAPVTQGQYQNPSLLWRSPTTAR